MNLMISLNWSRWCSCLSLELLKSRSQLICGNYWNASERCLILVLTSFFWTDLAARYVLQPNKLQAPVWQWLQEIGIFTIYPKMILPERVSRKLKATNRFLNTYHTIWLGVEKFSVAPLDLENVSNMFSRYFPPN